MNYPCEKQPLPLVSVIIPAYNAEQFVERTLNSVLNQTYQNLEVIVVNDGSHDRTAEIVSEIAHRDDRVILLHQSNSGVAVARNLGIQHSKGEFIAPIDADDIWYPKNIEKQVQYILQAETSVGLVYSWSIDINENDEVEGEFRASSIEGEVYTTLLLHDFIANASSTLIRRECFERVGGYNIDLKAHNAQGSEDWDLYLRIAQYYHFQAVPEFLVGYRKLPNSMSCNYASMAKSRELVWKSIRQRHPSVPATIYRLSTSSYYMNLARQSSRCGRHRDTLFSIYKALRSDFISPLLRSGFYILSAKSLVNLMVASFKLNTWKSSAGSVQTERKVEVYQPDVKSSNLGNQKKLKGFKILAERVLHWLAPILFGSPKTWQQ
jgi:glycosyltransferase involved in cell wall biosynthesis